jgi:hypothetical protein
MVSTGEGLCTPGMIDADTAPRAAPAARQVRKPMRLPRSDASRRLNPGVSPEHPQKSHAHQPDRFRVKRTTCAKAF